MIRRSFLPFFCCAVAAQACAPATAARHPDESAATEVPGETTAADENAEVGPPAPKVVERGAVERGARPFEVTAQRTGESVGEEIFYSRLASASAVCVGERHDELLDHFLELAILRGLVERRPMRGFELGVAFEMVRTTDQPALDAFAKGRFEVEQIPERTRWSEEWGFSFEYFRPHFDEMKLFGGMLPLALGVPRTLTRAVAERGLDGLEPKETRLLPELELGDAEHRRLFDRLMGGHPHGDPENFYAAQVLWDEAMATTAAKFLSERAPVRKLLVFAGAAHCHRRAIPARLERRTQTPVVNVLVARDEEPEELRAGYDYLVRFR